MTRIRTYTNPIRRVGATLWQACDDYVWLPMAIVGVLLLIVGVLDSPH